MSDFQHNPTDLLAAAAWVVEAGPGPSAEQSSVLRAMSRALTGSEDLPAAEKPAAIPQGTARRAVQLAIVVSLCRHPADPAQLERLDQLGDALGVGAEEREQVRAWAHESAADATEDFVRIYGQHLPGLREVTLRSDDGRLAQEWIGRMRTMDPGSLGRCYLDFHARNGFHLPGEDTPEPAYYVSHDMGHVIAGYEPTGPGEIALGAYKLAMSDTDDNWMAFMTNLLIHEAGLIKHGSDEQFVAYGGEIYPDAAGQGALHLPGAADLVAEAFLRGAAATSDFSAVDHLSIAHRPLVEVREEFGVVPRSDDYDGGNDRPWGADPAS